MDKKIEIKEEDPLAGDIASKNEREFFQKVIAVKTSTDAVLLDTDCDMTVKTEIKSDVASESRGELHPGHPVILDKKYNSDHDMCNKTELIEIKEEPLQLETEASSVWDSTKDVDLPRVKSSRFSPETVDGAFHGKSPLLSVEFQARDASSYDGMDHLEYHKSDVTEILTANEDDHPEKYGMCSDEGDMYIQPLYLNPKGLGNVDKRQQCSICAKTFTCESHLRAHILIHEGKRSHKCKVCNKTFTQLSSLKAHNLGHEGKKEHQCKVCGKSFIQLSNLKRHNLVHEGKKPYRCEVCDKHFNQVSTLKRHNLVHDGKKPYQCKICDKSFTQKSTLKRHNLVHEGKKVYQCKVGDKSFTQVSALERDNVAQEGKTQHHCKVCDKSFIQLSNLKRHNLVHEGNKPFRCEVCDKRFTQVTTLKRHN